MPGPVVQSPGIPWWVDPKGASVLDKPGQGMLRQIVGLLGLDDPAQIMAVGVPVEAGANTGGMLDVLSQKFPRLANAIKAYHGSPHDFERFDSSKIGTGEGAQAYGHGLYFAEQETTAKAYRDALAAQHGLNAPAKRVVVEGVPLAEHPQFQTLSGRAQQRVQSALSFDVDKQKALQTLKYQIGQPQTDQDAIREAMAFVRDMPEAIERTARNPGKMYEVAIHAHPDQFLDWDKPLSQQPESVRQTVRAAYGDVRPVRLKDGTYSVTRVGRAGAEGRILYGVEGATPEAAMKSFETDYLGSMHGSDVYHDLRKIEGGESDLSAWQLNRAGLPGIKYLDQGSRAAGEGSRNYVVFDDRLVDILKKYGIVATVAGAGAANQPERKQ